MSHDGNLLSVRDLRTYFETEDGTVRAVDGISFDLKRGETLGIVGESGSGKSVTNLSVLRLIPSPPGRIVSGEVLFHGQDILSLPEDEVRKIRGKRISMIFQDPMTSLNPFMRISKQLMEITQLHRALVGRLLGDVVVHPDGLGDLVADGVDRRQRRQRILEHHRDARAT